MTFISITRLHLRAPWLYPLTYWHSFFSIRQIGKAEGFLGGKLLLDDRGALWTLTVWEKIRDTMRYRNSGAHKKAMPLLLWMCDEAAVVHWQQETDELPSWDVARDRLEAEGRFSDLPHGNDFHQAKQIPMPKINSKFAEQKIAPKAIKKPSNRLLSLGKVGNP